MRNVWFFVYRWPSDFVLQLEIKNHTFFSPINWDDLNHKRITPPFNPNVVSRNKHYALMLTLCPHLLETPTAPQILLLDKAKPTPRIIFKAGVIFDVSPTPSIPSVKYVDCFFTEGTCWHSAHRSGVHQRNGTKLSEPDAGVLRWHQLQQRLQRLLLCRQRRRFPVRNCSWNRLIKPLLCVISWESPAVSLYGYLMAPWSPQGFQMGKIPWSNNV